jgi:PEP-CTERM motif
MTLKLRFLATAAALFGIFGQAQAGPPLDFFGTFTQDDNVRTFSFANQANSSVTIETFSYAGGTDPTGRVVAAGGFDTVFGLFDATGALLQIGDDGATRTDPVTGAAFDALVTLTLAPGTYFIALAEYDNYPIGPQFSNGFLEAGKGNFTSLYGCSAGKFCDINGFSRTGNFDVAISGAAIAAVPEPSTTALMSLALLGLIGRSKLARRFAAGRGRA